MGIPIRQYRRLDSERAIGCRTPIGEELSAVMMFCFAQSRYVSGAENIYLAEQISQGSRRFAQNFKAPEGRYVISQSNQPKSKPRRGDMLLAHRNNLKQKPRRGDMLLANATTRIKAPAGRHVNGQLK